MIKIALIDNYDSFTYNLVHLLERSGKVEVEVFLNDKTDLHKLNQFKNVVISPGPGLPEQAGIVPTFLNHSSHEKNILGICLGHQALGEHLGCKLKNLNQVIHGMASPITHFSNDLLFQSIPSIFNAGRYHSWVIDKNSISPDLEVTATDSEGEIMGIKHKRLNLHGLQFHPESILSEYGEVIMENWINSFK